MNENISYWLSNINKPSYPILEDDIAVDVAIVGGGLSGVQIAYYLEKEGFNIAILESNLVGHGASGYTTAKITSQHNLIYDKLINSMGEELAKEYAHANESAIYNIKDLIDKHNIDCDFNFEPAIIYTNNDDYVEKIKKEVFASAKLGLESSLISDIPFKLPIKAGIRFENQANFNPVKYLLSLCKILSRKNVQIFENTRVVDIEKNDDYILRTDNHKKIKAKYVVIASHFPFDNVSKLYFTRIYPERSYAVAIKTKEPFPHGMYISAEEPTRSMRRIVSDTDNIVIVGGNNHKPGEDINTDDNYSNLVDFSRELFEDEDVLYKWSTQDCMTMDSVPYIGRFSKDDENLFIATGYNKWGMTNSMVSAMLISDLIVKGSSPWENVYNPSRLNIGASAKNFIKENLNSMKHLISNKINIFDTNEIVLEKNQCAVIIKDFNRIGAYKDDEGVVHMVDITCTHLKCELNWNSAEKSWDCPCHGSRFDYKGAILHGPALEPLKKYI